MVAPILLAAGIGAGGSLLSGLLGNKAAKKAAAAQLAMQQQALDYAKQGQERATAVLQPGSDYMPAQTRLEALYGLNGGQAQQDAFSAFQTTPGFEFRKNQALEAATRGAAARGGAMSGRTVSALAGLGDGLASQEYGNYVSGLDNIWKTKLGVAGDVAAGFRGGSSSLASLMAGMGDTRANGIVGGANAWTNALQGLTGNAAYGLGAYNGQKDPSRSSYGVY